jgi:hypothetical protein
MCWSITFWSENLKGNDFMGDFDVKEGCYQNGSNKIGCDGLD